MLMLLATAFLGGLTYGLNFAPDVYNYNFFIRERVGIGDGATLKPKRGNAYRIGAKAGYKWFFAEVFYDYMHLKKSNTATVVDGLSGTSLDIYQPDSKRKMVGVNVGIRF